MSCLSGHLAVVAAPVGWRSVASSHKGLICFGTYLRSSNSVSLLHCRDVFEVGATRLNLSKGCRNQAGRWRLLRRRTSIGPGLPNCIRIRLPAAFQQRELSLHAGAINVQDDATVSKGEESELLGPLSQGETDQQVQDEVKAFPPIVPSKSTSVGDEKSEVVPSWRTAEAEREQDTNGALPPIVRFYPDESNNAGAESQEAVPRWKIAQAEREQREQEKRARELARRRVERKQRELAQRQRELAQMREREQAEGSADGSQGPFPSLYPLQQSAGVNSAVPGSPLAPQGNDISGPVLSELGSGQYQGEGTAGADPSATNLPGVGSPVQQQAVGTPSPKDWTFPLVKFYPEDTSAADGEPVPRWKIAQAEREQREREKRAKELARRRIERKQREMAQRQKLIAEMREKEIADGTYIDPWSFGKSASSPAQGNEGENKDQPPMESWRIPLGQPITTPMESWRVPLGQPKTAAELAQADGKPLESWRVPLGQPKTAAELAQADGKPLESWRIPLGQPRTAAELAQADGKPLESWRVPLGQPKTAAELAQADNKPLESWRVPLGQPKTAAELAQADNKPLESWRVPLGQPKTAAELARAGNKPLESWRVPLGQPKTAAELAQADNKPLESWRVPLGQPKTAAELAQADNKPLESWRVPLGQPKTAAELAQAGNKPLESWRVPLGQPKTAAELAQADNKPLESWRVPLGQPKTAAELAQADSKPLESWRVPLGQPKTAAELAQSENKPLESWRVPLGQPKTAAELAQADGKPLESWRVPLGQPKTASELAQADGKPLESWRVPLGQPKTAEELAQADGRPLESWRIPLGQPKTAAELAQADGRPLESWRIPLGSPMESWRIPLTSSSSDLPRTNEDGTIRKITIAEREQQERERRAKELTRRKFERRQREVAEKRRQLEEIRAKDLADGGFKGWNFGPTPAPAASPISQGPSATLSGSIPTPAANPVSQGSSETLSNSNIPTPILPEVKNSEAKYSGLTGEAVNSDAVASGQQEVLTSAGIPGQAWVPQLPVQDHTQGMEEGRQLGSFQSQDANRFDWNSPTAEVVPAQQQADNGAKDPTITDLEGPPYWRVTREEREQQERERRAKELARRKFERKQREVAEKRRQLEEFRLKDIEEMRANERAESSGGPSEEWGSGFSPVAPPDAYPNSPPIQSTGGISQDWGYGRSPAPAYPPPAYSPPAAGPILTAYSTETAEFPTGMSLDDEEFLEHVLLERKQREARDSLPPWQASGYPTSTQPWGEADRYEVNRYPTTNFDMAPVQQQATGNAPFYGVGPTSEGFPEMVPRRRLTPAEREQEEREKRAKELARRRIERKQRELAQKQKQYAEERARELLENPGAAGGYIATGNPPIF